MPNWVKNNVTIKGDCGDFWTRVERACTEGSSALFNEFVPRPECYDFDTTNYRTEEQKSTGFNGHNLMKVGTVIGYGDNAFTVTEEYLVQFRKAEKEQEKYGAIGWYDWNCTYWGTKWDACEVDVSQSCSEIEFQTAWSYPDAFFKALSIEYPKARFYVMYADEDIGSNCGAVMWMNGEEKELDVMSFFAEAVWEGNMGSNLIENSEWHYEEEK